MLPDFSYLRGRVDDIEAIVVTHGHEDHLGALPWVLRELGQHAALPPVYAGALTVAMARSANPNSGGSQFYICIDDARFLDKQYTVFGQTLEGQDVVDQIRVGDVMETVTIETGD